MCLSGRHSLDRGFDGKPQRHHLPGFHSWCALLPGASYNAGAGHFRCLARVLVHPGSICSLRRRCSLRTKQHPVWLEGLGGQEHLVEGSWKVCHRFALGLLAPEPQGGFQNQHFGADGQDLAACGDHPPGPESAGWNDFCLLDRFRDVGRLSCKAWMPMSALDSLWCGFLMCFFEQAMTLTHKQLPDLQDRIRSMCQVNSMAHPPYVEKKMTILVQDMVKRGLKKQTKLKKRFIVGWKCAIQPHCVMHSLSMIFVCPAYRICMWIPLKAINAWHGLGIAHQWTSQMVKQVQQKRLSATRTWSCSLCLSWLAECWLCTWKILSQCCRSIAWSAVGPLSSSWWSSSFRCWIQIVRWCISWLSARSHQSKRWPQVRLLESFVELQIWEETRRHEKRQWPFA